MSPDCWRHYLGDPTNYKQYFLLGAPWHYTSCAEASINLPSSQKYDDLHLKGGHICDLQVFKVVTGGSSSP